jgi:hypothetical protein
MATKRKTKEKSAAVISIFAASEMTPKGRREIAAWLRRHADMLVKEGKKYTSGRFTGRYLYT